MEDLLPVPFFIIAASIYSICWLIDRKDQRSFCRKATPEQLESYLRILSASNKQQPAPVKKLITNIKKTLKAA